MNTENKILNDNQAQSLIDALKPLTPAQQKAQQKKIDAAKSKAAKEKAAKEKAAKLAREKAAKEKAAKEKAAKLAREKAAKEKELSDKKNQAAADRAAALARADAERARQAKELAEFQAKQADLKQDATTFESSQKVFVMLDKDCYGITALGIATGLVRSDLYANAVWDGIAAIDDIDVCINRLNEVYPMLTDDKKQTLIKGMQNRCSPSNVGKRSVILHLVGKIGCKAGVFTKITQTESDQKSKAAKVLADKRAEEKRLKDEKKVREESLTQSTVEPKESVVTDKPASQISTVVHGDPLPTGQDARKRLVAQFIVTAIDQFSLDELEEIIMQLDEHVTKNRIVLKAVVNG